MANEVANGADDGVISNNSPQCTGRAAEALKAFRTRQSELKREGRSKPDMVAYKELKATWTPEQSHGQIEGVPVGLRLEGRGEAAILGIHTEILRGINARKDEACYAICICGKYVDDEDAASDGTIIYTGCGGQKKGRQVEDQPLNTYNLSLITSYDTQEPIRLLRGRTGKHKNEPPEYYYDGLYQCVFNSYEASAHGPKVYKFTLKPMAHQSSRKRSITVQTDLPSTAQATAASSDGAVRDRLLGVIKKKRKIAHKSTSN